MEMNEIALPIVENHDKTRNIGWVTLGTNCAVVTLTRPLCRDEIFQVFGSVAVQVIAGGDKDLITEFRIIEWSLNANPLVKEIGEENERNNVGRYIMSVLRRIFRG